MPTPPSEISGYLASLAVDPDAIVGANGSPVSSLGPYAAASGYAPPTLKASGLNGRKTLAFARGQALAAPIAASPSPPSGNLSLGAFPGGFSVVMVVKPTALTQLTVSPRRALMGFRNTPGEGTWWAINTTGGAGATGKQEVVLLDRASGYTTWGSFGGGGDYALSANGWYVVGITVDGATLKQYRGYALDKTSTNTLPENYTQFVNAFVLGAELTYPGDHDFEGEVAAVAPFGRPISEAEYVSVAEWFVARFGLSARGVNVEAETGVGGQIAFVSFRDAATGLYLPIKAPLNISGLSCKINGGASVTATQVVRSYDFVNLRIPTVGIVLPTVIDADDVVTVSIAAGAVNTDAGLVEPLVDATVTNRVGQATLLDTSAPDTFDLKLGYNFNGAASYWWPEISLKNIYSSGGAGSVETRPVDANGYFTSPTVGTTIPFSIPSGNVTPGDPAVIDDSPCLEFGRYIVSWEGADGANLELVTQWNDNSQTTITHVSGSDVLTGTTKKRYFDVTAAGGSIRNRPAFALRYAAAAYCYNIKVMLARYEGTSGYLSDQAKDRHAGMHVVRQMDGVQTNMSNIGNAADFTPITEAYYGMAKERTIPISRIETWDGPIYGQAVNYEQWLVTFAVPHGLSSGQRFTVESTDDGPVNVTLAGGITRDVSEYNEATNNYPLSGVGIATSPTQFTFLEWRSPGYTHLTTTTPFTGSNARARVNVVGGTPVELIPAIANECDVPICHINIPHSLNPAGVASMATTIAGLLDAGRKVWVETSNEPWNFAFSQWSFYRSDSIHRGLVPPGESSPYPAYCAHSLENFDTFSAAWVAAGRSASDLQIYFNVQHAGPGTSVQVASFLAANRPALRPRIGIAPYHEPTGFQFSPGVDYTAFTLETILDCHEAYVKSWSSVSFVPVHRAAYESRGIAYDLCCYEAQFAYLGLSPKGSTGTRDEQWGRYNLESFCSYFHPRTYHIAWHRLKEMQAAGIDAVSFYSYSHTSAYEFPSQGRAAYQDFWGLQSVAGKGDGTDGKPDNRSLIVNETGNPKWPNAIPLTSPRAGAMRAWTDFLGVPSPPGASVSPVLWSRFRKLWR